MKKLPFVFLPRATHDRMVADAVRSDETLRRAALCIHAQVDLIRDLRKGHENYEISLQNMRDFIEAEAEYKLTQARRFDQQHDELRIARKRLEMIEGILMSLDELAKSSRLAKRISDIIDAEIEITRVAGSAPADPVNEPPTPEA